MPRVMLCDDTGSASLEETVDRLSRTPFDPAREDSLDAATCALRLLANNRDFLADLMIDQLRQRHSRYDAGGYGPQSLVLSPMVGGCFLRANIWPSEQESCFHASGARTFVYGTPHDHNFSFLTAGYFGPGYRSDYYEYDYESVAGYAGEPVNLRFVERSALEEGRLLLYRAHRDVHSQIPPESLSVSLNVMHIDPAQGWMDQYGFDLDKGTVTGILSPTSTETFLRCAVGLGNPEALDLAEHFGSHHPSDRMRLASFEARALLLDVDAQDDLWRAAEGSGSRMVAKSAHGRRQELALP